jgi:hypothetical protein
VAHVDLWVIQWGRGVERKGGRRGKSEELRMRNEEVRINGDKLNTQETK